LVGGVLGVAVAPLAVRALIAFLPHDLATSALRGSLSFRLLAFAFFASLAAGLLSGVAPALHASGGSLISSLRERAGTGFGGVRLRKCIVTLQVAFSLILVIAPGCLSGHSPVCSPKALASRPPASSPSPSHPCRVAIPSRAPRGSSAALTRRSAPYP